uniref:Uncharacterized protein n=1 Tax=Rhabditophanes sp. KR3021 TaxID=114890 RepID=A0AC35TWI7_9BILA
MSLFGMYYGDDNHANMSICFKPISDQLKTFKEITIGGKLYPVNLHLNGDYKFICSALGHTGAASKFPCIKCVVKTMEGRKCRLWSDYDNSECFHRSTIVAKPEDNNFSFTLEKIFDVEEDNVHFPFLHILMGIFQRLFKQLKVYLVELDKNGIDGRLIYDIEDNEYYDQPVFNFEDTLAGDFDDDDYDVFGQNLDDSSSQIDIDEAPTTFLDQMNQNLKKINAKASRFWQTFSGNNVSKILEKLDQLFMDLDKSEKMRLFRHVFEALRDVKRKAGAETLSKEGQKEAVESITAFRKALTNPLLEFTMQPKAHFLMNHMPEQLELYASMNFFSEQPIESMHASINKDMFRVSSFNELDKLYISW